MDVVMALNDKRQLERQVLMLSSGAKAELRTRQSPAVQPRWAKFFDGTEATLNRLRNRSASALLFLQEKNRLFAVAFGMGRHDLKPGAWEEAFGLRVTVNSIDETKIRSIDTKTSRRSRGTRERRPVMKARR